MKFSVRSETMQTICFALHNLAKGVCHPPASVTNTSVVFAKWKSPPDEFRIILKSKLVIQNK